ncbi:MAG: mycothiol system anti-sigma-R factor [Actinomycetota bacterium]|nr:mycothiol system anti-sigma-R factor [Actinomycetota bacterium]MDH5224242.1 mycothiol system anti-sigma-R factor [Actinomycetota bacterium]MDH5313039.1 mycothiol system anti-sigma-R factor [Actinomycetota bacterium]
MTTPELHHNCDETLRDIESFLDGEVDVVVQQRIEVHLSDCSPCMKRAEFRRHVKVMIRSKCAGDDVPPTLERRIRSLLDEPPVVQ